MKTRLTAVLAASAALLSACTSSERTSPRPVVVSSPDRPLSGPVDGLNDEQVARAATVGITDAAPVFCDESAVIATARAPLYAGPSVSTRLLGHIGRGVTVTVVDKRLWYRLPPHWSASTYGERDGLIPTWAQVEFHDGTSMRRGFVAWSALGDPDRAISPAAAMAAAEAMALPVAVASHGGGHSTDDAFGHHEALSGDPDHGWAEGIAAAAPDFAFADALITAADPRILPTRPAEFAVELDLADPTPAEAFFLGRCQAAKLLAGSEAIAPDHPAVAMLGEVGRQVAAASTVSRPYGEWIWVVLDDDAHANSFSLPGGFVFVTTGMLRMIEDQDELAAVLAHEIAHVEAGHGIAAGRPVDRAPEIELEVVEAMEIEHVEQGEASPDDADHGDGHAAAHHGDDASHPDGREWAMETEFEIVETTGGDHDGSHGEQVEQVEHGGDGAHSLHEVVAGESVVVAACPGGPLSVSFFHTLVLGHGRELEAAADARAIALLAAAGFDPAALSGLLARMDARGFLHEGYHYSPSRLADATEATAAFRQTMGGGMEGTGTPRSSAESYRAVIDAMPASSGHDGHHGHDGHGESDASAAAAGH